MQPLTTMPAGFLEHLPNGGNLYYMEPALQKVIPGYFGCPLIHKANLEVIFIQICPGEVLHILQLYS